MMNDHLSCGKTDLIRDLEHLATVLVEGIYLAKTPPNHQLCPVISVLMSVLTFRLHDP